MYRVWFIANIYGTGGAALHSIVEGFETRDRAEEAIRSAEKQETGSVCVRAVRLYE